MKRLTFNPHSRDMILDHRKDMTHRWKPIPGVHEGDICAAVTGRPGKPAFLTPASEAFATLRITKVTAIFFKDLDEGAATRSGFDSLAEARCFYLKENPTASEFSRLHRYEWERACRQCHGQMVLSSGFVDVMTGSPDELGSEVVTMNYSGHAALTDCIKCRECGWSVTV